MRLTTWAAHRPVAPARMCCNRRARAKNRTVTDFVASAVDSGGNPRIVAGRPSTDCGPKNPRINDLPRPGDIDSFTQPHRVTYCRVLSRRITCRETLGTLRAHSSILELVAFPNRNRVAVTRQASGRYFLPFGTALEDKSKGVGSLHSTKRTFARALRRGDGRGVPLNLNSAKPVPFHQIRYQCAAVNSAIVSAPGNYAARS